MSYAPHRAIALEKEEHRVTSSEVPLVLTPLASPLTLAAELGEKDLREHYVRVKARKGQLGDAQLLVTFELWEHGKQQLPGEVPCFCIARRFGNGDEHLELVQQFVVGHNASWRMTLALEGSTSDAARVNIAVELGIVWGADGAVYSAAAVLNPHDPDGYSSSPAIGSFGAMSPSDSELSLGDALAGMKVGEEQASLRRSMSWKEDEDYDADEDHETVVSGFGGIESVPEFRENFSPADDIDYTDHGSVKYNIKPDQLKGSPDRQRKGVLENALGQTAPEGQMTPGGPPTPGGPDDDFGFIKMEAEAAEQEKQSDLLESQRSFAKSQLSSDIQPCAAMQAAIKLWPRFRRHTVLTYPMHRAIIDMNRSSKYKDQVYELGLIRPFLLLVSMHPEARISWAKILGVPIWDAEYSGDSHQEAWEMLVGNPKSLQARLSCVYSKQGDWYQILYKTCKKALLRSQPVHTDQQVVLEDLTPASMATWKETFVFCSEPRNSSMLSLEEILLRGLVEMFDEIKSDHEIPAMSESTKLLIAGDMIDPLVARLKCAGFKDNELIRRLSATTYEGRVHQIVQGLGQFCGFSNVTMSTPGIKGEQSVRMANLPSSVVGLNLVLAATPLIALSPLIVLPALALTGEGTKYELFTQTPYEVLMPIIGICSQREMLAYQNICVDDFYPASMEEFVSLGRGDSFTPGKEPM